MLLICPLWCGLLYRHLQCPVHNHQLCLRKSKLGVHGTPTFSSPISTATTLWWTTAPVKECCTPGTTSVWSVILSLLNHKSKKETVPAQNCTELKRFSFNRAENRVQLKSGRTRSGVMASPISLVAIFNDRCHYW